jgi:hypothetical protein
MTKYFDWFTKKYLKKFSKKSLNNVEKNFLERYIKDKTDEFMDSLENMLKGRRLSNKI